MTDDVEFDEAAAEEEFKDHIGELARIKRLEAELKAAREKHTAALVPLLRRLGTRVFEDPVDGTPKVATVIEAERLEVDAGRLLEALIEQHQGDVEAAEAVWKDVLKPPAVDTKDEGLLYQATIPTDPNDPHTARIWPETLLAAGAAYKKSAAYIGFSKPGG